MAKVLGIASVERNGEPEDEPQSGLATPSPVENLYFVGTDAAIRIAETIDALKAEFELIVVDLPAAGQLGESSLPASHLDGVLLVVESERTRAAAAARW